VAVQAPAGRPRAESDSHALGGLRVNPPATPGQGPPRSAMPMRAQARAQSVGHGYSAPILPGAALDIAGKGLEGIIKPGDVLFVRGAGGLLEIGTAGGMLGHVMLVVKTPQRIAHNSAHARYLKSVWPAGVGEIWKVLTVESARGRSGLHEADLYLYIDRKSRRLLLLGELGDGEFDISNEACELWQSPEELRTHLTHTLVEEVLDDMRAQGASANWSWTTAARAVLRADDHLNDCNDKGQLMQEIQDCWAIDPICTSVVIAFWQRALCKLARTLSSSQQVGRIKPADLILQWLPLKADRSLPGILLDTMRRCGWTKRTTVAPRAPSKTLSTNELGRRHSGMVDPGSPHATFSPRCPVIARYCGAHNSTSKRGKVDPRYQECSACKLQIQTNYAEFTLCPKCSDRQDRCMICGVACHGTPSVTPLEAKPRSFMPHNGSGVGNSPKPDDQSPLAGAGDGAASHMAQAPGMGTACSTKLPAAGVGGPPTQAAASPPPPPQVPAPSMAAKYCTSHNRTEKRPKTEPRFCECSSCHVQIQTNYADFAMCPPCSDKHNRCMICGTSALEHRSYLPMPVPPRGEEPITAKLGLQAGSPNALGDIVPPLPLGSSFPTQSPPRFCALHNRSEKRCKGEPKLRECTGCHMQIQTNYADFSLCPPCSERHDRCMICGSNASEHRSFLPLALPSAKNEETSANTSRLGGAQQGQVPPRYCNMHDSTQKRTKGEPRFRECTVCHMMVQTNYADFSLCPPCSDREKRCMLCGTGASLGSGAGGGSCIMPVPVPGLLSR